jgi:sodium/potassium-transporting ATPase subunit alpha
LVENYHTNIETGLSSVQAEIKIKEFGENQLTAKTTPWYVAFLKEQTNFFSLLLYVGGVLCFIGYSIDTVGNVSTLYLGIMLVVVCFATGCYSYS